MNDKLYKFTDDRGSFVSTVANNVKALYLPLANERLMSPLSAYLHGDIKTR